MLTESELDMQKRALAWASDRGGNVVTREQAIGEDHMALDVLELLEEVARLRALPASVPPTPGIPEHLQLNMAKVREAIDKLTSQHDRDLAEITRLDGELAKAHAELARMRPVYEMSLAMRRAESRSALASDVIVEIEAEMALTDAEVEARTHVALTRWRTVADAALATESEASKESDRG